MTRWLFYKIQPKVLQFCHCLASTYLLCHPSPNRVNTLCKKRWTYSAAASASHLMLESYARVGQRSVVLTLSNCVGSLLPTLSLVGAVCNFTWQYEKHKGHKSGSKWKLVHFPLCSLPWINDAMMWACFVAFFLSLSIACATGALSWKQYGSVQAKAQSEH